MTIAQTAGGATNSVSNDTAGDERSDTQNDQILENTFDDFLRGGSSSSDL